jgi:hypothetical protein
MLRLVMLSIFCLIVSFGAMAKSYHANVLLNHVSEKHTSHSHGDHSHDHPKKSDKNESNHNHQLELSLVTQALHFEMSLPTDFVALLALVYIRPFFPERSLRMSHYSFSIFRPPIA